MSWLSAGSRRARTRRRRPRRFRTLPEHIPLEDTISTQEVDPAPDPTMGRDTELEFLLRNAGPV